MLRHQDIVAEFAAPRADDRPLPGEVAYGALDAASKCTKAIAQQLAVATSTVTFHVAGLLKKLAVSSRSEAAVIGLRAGIVRQAMSAKDAG